MKHLISPISEEGYWCTSDRRELPKIATATDLAFGDYSQVFPCSENGWKFVEYFGPGLKSLSLADRATVANMAPEYGATCVIFLLMTRDF